jgi:hypothetical protein
MSCLERSAVNCRIKRCVVSECNCLNVIFKFRYCVSSHLVRQLVRCCIKRSTFELDRGLFLAWLAIARIAALSVRLSPMGFVKSMTASSKRDNIIAVSIPPGRLPSLLCLRAFLTLMAGSMFFCTKLGG